MKRSILIFAVIFLFLLYGSIAVAQNFGPTYAMPLGTAFFLWCIFGVYLFDFHETNAKK